MNATTRTASPELTQAIARSHEALRAACAAHYALADCKGDVGNLGMNLSAANLELKDAERAVDKLMGRRSRKS